MRAEPSPCPSASANDPCHTPSQAASGHEGSYPKRWFPDPGSRRRSRNACRKASHPCIRRNTESANAIGYLPPVAIRNVLSSELASRRRRLSKLITPLGLVALRNVPDVSEPHNALGVSCAPVKARHIRNNFASQGAVRQFCLRDSFTPPLCRLRSDGVSMVTGPYCLRLRS